MFPIRRALLPVFSQYCFQNAEPHVQVGLCLIALPKEDKFTRLDLRAFAGFCGRFAGNFGCSHVHLKCVGALDMGMAWARPWDTARMQAMFNHIQDFTCGDSLAIRPSGKKTRQTSRIRRDAEKLYVILGCSKTTK